MDNIDVNFQNVFWRRNDNWILTDINWQIKKSEHWALLGLNGSGKTTLLNMINGYIWPTQGQMEVLGCKFGSIDLRELRKLIGWVSSSLQSKFYRGDRVLDIVVSGLYASIGLYQKPLVEDYDEARKKLILLKCEHLQERVYESLSQGEQQKVLIARALISEPQLLILDEPCAGLDVFAREHLLATVSEIATAECVPTMVYVTHHIEEVIPVFSKTLLLKEGKVFAKGDTEQMLDSKNLSDFFNRKVLIDWHNERAWLKVL